MQSIPSPLLGHTALHPALRSALPAALFATSLATHALTLNAANFSAAVLLPVGVYILCESSTLLLAPLPRLHGLPTGSGLARHALQLVVPRAHLQVDGVEWQVQLAAWEALWRLLGLCHSVAVAVSATTSPIPARAGAGATAGVAAPRPKAPPSFPVPSRPTAAPTSPAVATADFASSSCSTSAALATAAAATAAGTVHGSRLVADHLPLHRRACEER